MTRTNMPSILDREVTSRDLDAFGHRHFADGLRSLIEADTLPPPFSIGLLGGWGTGKSTIKALYLAELREDETGRRRRIHTVTFNAWRYSENVKRALLRQVHLAIGGSEKSLDEKLYGETRRTELQQRKLRAMLTEMLESWSLPLAVVLVFLGLVFLVTWALLSALGISSELAKTIASGVIATLSTYLASQVRGNVAKAHQPITRVELPTTTAEQYQDLLLRQLREFKGGKAKIKDARYCERLAVFIDDLDRLSAEEMVQGLDAIRTFMEIPESDLPDGLGLVFVISCDEERIAHALERGRRHADLPGSVFNRSGARRYLDRIFQFRLEIPPFPRRDMREYALRRLQSLNLPDLKAHPGDVAEKMIHVGVQSPRNALQIINSFAQSWWIAHQRENLEAGSDKPGALYEGAVTRHPLTLAALCALRADFPDFYTDLQRHQDLIHRFIDVVFERQSFDDLPERTRETLSRYLEKHTGDGKAVNYGPGVDADHRPLRQFLATLQNHQWPPSIQPLLLLSQDAISLHYGDGKHALYDALVSGDLQGVLEVLGRDADAKPLRPDDVHLLKDMTEDLVGESDARRISATTVLASLVDRFPDGTARALVGPLTRQLEASPEVRWRLGVPRIQGLLSVAEPAEQRAVAAALIGDVLTTEQPMAFRLESAEPPSLEEAIAITRETVGCVLAIRGQHGLPQSSDSRLGEWLLTRSVNVEGAKAKALPFRELHDWVKEHTNHLLELLGSGYTDLLISELEAEASDVEVSEGLRFAKQVFGDLHRSGEDSRPILWEQLTRLAAVKNKDAVQLAWETLSPHRTLPSADAYSGLVFALCGRLAQEMEDQEAWALDWKTGAEAILGLVEARTGDLSAEARVAFNTLVRSWGEVEQTAGFAVRALRSLNEAGLATALEEWLPKLLEGLPHECVDAVADLYPDVTDAQRSVIAAQLQTVVATTAMSKEKGASYRRFIEKLPEDAWKLAPMKDHLAGLLPQIGSSHTNPSEYLFRVFPSTVKVLRFAEPAAVGSMLHTLFTNAKGQPAHYGWLHSWMAQRWPKKSDTFAPYAPETIFAEAHQFAAAQPQAATKGLLNSMKGMIERNIVPAKQTEQLIASTCTVWGSNQEDAVGTLLTLKEAPSPQLTADLLDPVNWDEAAETERLGKAWKHVATLQGPDERAATTRLMLAKGAKGEDDQALRLWFDAKADHVELLAAALRDSGNQDVARRRLWTMAMRLKGTLGPDFFRPAIAHLLLLEDNEETARAVVESKVELGAVFNDADARNKLANTILCEVFPQAPTSTVKGGVADWAKSLDADALVKSLDPGTLTLDDVGILENHFGGSTTKKLRKAVEKDSENKPS